MKYGAEVRGEGTRAESAPRIRKNHREKFRFFFSDTEISRRVLELSGTICSRCDYQTTHSTEGGRGGGSFCNGFEFAEERITGSAGRACIASVNNKSITTKASESIRQWRATSLRLLQSRNSFFRSRILRIKIYTKLNVLHAEANN